MASKSVYTDYIFDILSMEDNFAYKEKLCSFMHDITHMFEHYMLPLLKTVRNVMLYTYINFLCNFRCG